MDTAEKLLSTIRDLHKDGVLESAYGFDKRRKGQPTAPLEAAVYAWAAAGYPGLTQAIPADKWERIHVADLDPDTLVGIAPCDDGDDGWVVLAVRPDPDAPGAELVAPVGDWRGDIVYLDILDAAEVLKTGKVWRHDMGEDEEEDPTEEELQAAQRVRDHARIGGTFGDEDDGEDLAADDLVRSTP